MSGTHAISMGDRGRLVVPADVRERLGLTPGTPLVLLEAPDGLVLLTREQLLDRVWGRDIYVDTRTVDVHVGRLRKALSVTGGDDPLRTVRGAGYSLG